MYVGSTETLIPAVLKFDVILLHLRPLHSLPSLYLYLVVNIEMNPHDENPEVLQTINMEVV